MSLNFSRRSFFRLIAAAALAVACTGMLTACGEDADKPYIYGTGTITLLQVKTTVPNAPTFESDSNAITFKDVYIYNGRTNNIRVDSSAFNVLIERDGSVVADITPKVTLTSNSETKDTWSIAKKDSITVNITATPSVSVQAGDTVTLRYRPDDTYKEMYCRWIFENAGCTVTVSGQS